MPKTNLLRRLGVAFLTTGLTVIPAWTALAVTNPADNPSPITVLGDDGNTYHDGADTLPGFDDEECTYIPGAWFDFAHNKVHYADGQSIPWTEWDRASGYREWQAAQASQTTQGNTDSTDTATNTGSNTSVKNKGTKTAATSSAATDVATTTDGVVTSEVSSAANETLAGTNVLVSVGKESSNNPGRVVGFSILGFLFGAGAVITVVHSLRQRLSGGHR